MGSNGTSGTSGTSRTSSGGGMAGSERRRLLAAQRVNLVFVRFAELRHVVESVPFSHHRAQKFSISSPHPPSSSSSSSSSNATWREREERGKKRKKGQASPYSLAFRWSFARYFSSTLALNAPPAPAPTPPVAVAAVVVVVVVVVPSSVIVAAPAP
jgi:hypothetical protein